MKFREEWSREFRKLVLIITRKDKINCEKHGESQRKNFRQNRTKYNINFSRDKERVSYYQQQTFHFNAEKSAPLTEDDSITIFNMYMNVSYLITL